RCEGRKRRERKFQELKDTLSDQCSRQCSKIGIRHVRCHEFIAQRAYGHGQHPLRLVTPDLSRVNTAKFEADFSSLLVRPAYASANRRLTRANLCEFVVNPARFLASDQDSVADNFCRQIIVWSFHLADNLKESRVRYSRSR